MKCSGHERTLYVSQVRTQTPRLVAKIQRTYRSLHLQPSLICQSGVEYKNAVCTHVQDVCLHMHAWPELASHTVKPVLGSRYSGTAPGLVARLAPITVHTLLNMDDGILYIVDGVMILLYWDTD